MSSRKVLVLISCVLIFYTSDTSVCGLKFGRWQKRSQESEPSKFERWFTQNLNHFSPNDERNWQQRYFVNDEYSSGDADLVFLKIGGEGEAGESSITRGSWITYAKEYKPILFLLEHRYYGKSHPTKDISLENLVYLTSEQALADTALFIKAMNKEYNLTSNVKWIVFGGSYAGSLAAWMRQKYPHLVHAAVSSSGPLLAQLNFPEYFQIVQDALLKNNRDCAVTVHQATTEVELLLADVDGREKINEMFKLCDDVNESVGNPLDMANFFQILADNFAEVVQYNDDRRLKDEDISIDRLCNIVTNRTIEPIIMRHALINDIMLKHFNNTCLDYKYSKMSDAYRNINWNGSVAIGDRQWLYQTCTEFGFYQTSNYEPQIFGNKFDLDFYIQLCEDIFGSTYNETFIKDAVAKTNTLYGGLDIEVTNVVFVHGSLDPWHVLGITETGSDQTPAILIDGASHCSNMNDPSDDDDSPQLKAARETIQKLLGIWIYT